MKVTKEFCGRCHLGMAGKCEKDASCEIITPQKTAEMLKGNKQFNDATKEIIKFGISNGNGMAIHNKKRDFVFICDREIFEGHDPWKVIDGLPNLIDNQKDADKVKEKVRKRIDEETIREAAAIGYLAG